MKRFLIIAVLCLSALTAKAQTIEVVLGEQPRIFLEKTRVMDNSISFAYLEGGYNTGAMVKLFHEQKFWKTPAYIHVEYQSTFNGSHTAIAGGSYSFGLPNGYIRAHSHRSGVYPLPSPFLRVSPSSYLWQDQGRGFLTE